MQRVSVSTFVAALGDALARGDGYIMGAYGQNPRTGYLDLSETDVKSAWKVDGWYYAQYADRAKYTAAQQAQALKWREQCVRVWDCNGLAEGIYQLRTGENINTKARYNYAQWCDPRGEGLIPAARRVPGAAVFWGKTAGSIEHVAYLYEPVEPDNPAGDWYLIEARGVMNGVVKTRLYSRKPGYWGLMTKYFDYDETDDAPTHVLQRGDKGVAVKAMQAALMGLGYDLGKWGADGEFGKATENAVKAFQRNHGLPETGIWGPAAQAKLDEAQRVPTYTVMVRGLTAVDVDLIRLKWPDCEVTEE
jgi:hypothetical protein